MGNITLVNKDADFIASVLRGTLNEVNEALASLEEKSNTFKQELKKTAGDDDKSQVLLGFADMFIDKRFAETKSKWTSQKDSMEKALILLYTGSEDIICPTEAAIIGGN